MRSNRSSHSDFSSVSDIYTETTEEANEALSSDHAEIKELLKKINVAQALSENWKSLVAAGGSDGLAAKLHTDVDQGIDGGTVETRRVLFGRNAVGATPRKSFFELFCDTFDDATLQILMVSAVVSLAVGIYDDPTAGYVEGCAILAAVLIVSVVTAANDYQKESQFRQLSTVSDDVDVVVVRGGLHWQIPVAEIVVGDVVRLDAGDEIPCDGVLLQAESLQVDESALTGEAVDVDKDLDTDPFVLSGCTVESGTGSAVAIAVGIDSQWGKIKAHLEKEQEQTPLQEKLDDMAALIGYVGMAAAGATFIAMMFIKVVIQPAYLADVSIFAHALEAFIIGVTIVVVAVPEGLPLAVTISLAFSTKKMLADQNLIRHLAACETMGNATNICSDKTGTLTENRMTVVKGVFADTRCEDTVHRVPTLISKRALEPILECIACCSTARIVVPKQEDQPPPQSQSPQSKEEDAGAGQSQPQSQSQQPPRPTIIGNKTEAALLLLAQSEWSHNDDTDRRRAAARFGKPGGGRLFPFSSKRKRMSVLVHKKAVENGDAADGDVPQEVVAKKQQTVSGVAAALKAAVGGGVGVDPSGSELENSQRSLQTQHQKKYSWTLYHKGAAELVLNNCSTYLDIDGQERRMSKKKRKEFERLIHEFAEHALRCVALAHRNDIQASCPDPAACTPEQVEELETDLCLDAVAGIMDPLRADVVDAVRTCQSAGIFVRMVTGDNLDTATAIAKQAGILMEDGISMTGEQFRNLTPVELDNILPKLQVLARSSPEDKHVLVQRLNGGLMPETVEQWQQVHPGRDYETMKDKLLPGYKEEWAASRHGGVGEVVGVTGDGTNDGPALKAADVGLSMGLSGTDVAKKASDIIIMDDRFSSIVKAVLWGRSVFDNIRKFLQFQLTVNVVALTITFLSAVAGYQPPLNAVMMLWVNLIMDTMGALALGTEPPRRELLDRRPYRRDASLISRPMWRNILCQAVYQLAVLVFLLNRGPRMFGCEDGSRHHFTIIFNAFVFCQVFNEFNAREIGDRFDPTRALQNSPMFLMVILFTVTAQWLIVEFGGDFTQTYPLDYNEWKITVGLGAVSLPVGLVMRNIPVSEDPSSFAGQETAYQRTISKSGRNWLAWLVAALVPVFVAIVYQLYWEIDEFIH